MKLFYFSINTSWGCIQALIVILSMVMAPGGAFDPGIDLLKGLNLHTNISQFDGVSITQGSQKRTAYKLQGTNRKLVLPSKIYRRAADLLKKNSDFTFAAVLRQEESNPGTIISFSNGYNRYLELQSSGRRNEIRFHYSYTTPNNELMVHMESFPYRLADNKWHKIALSISGTEIQLLVDCNPLYKRVTHFVPDRNFSASNMQLLVGQRNLNSHSLFKGELQEVHILPGPYGYLFQCEHMDSECPTCGQFLQLQNFIVQLRENLFQLTQNLEKSIARIDYLESCDCKKSCMVNETLNRNIIKEDGEVWDLGCNQCKCKGGKVTCYERPCAPLTCRHPVFSKDECCPKCLKTCYLNKIDYEHGDKQIIGCKNCSCLDGMMKCDNIICPKLTCAENKQLVVTDECCKYCPDADYCSMGHNCHVNATCLNYPTKYQCNCKEGLTGDGFNCTDIDECKEKGGEYGHHCNAYTNCVNIYSSYICECFTGYSCLDKFNCVEIDECATNQHLCHANATCRNTIGSYHCQCKEGFSGNGYNCSPVCQQSCLNGGECIEPNVCKCRTGYEGSSCEKDFDECASPSHGCKNTSDCVNMPGWYYCKCKPGYETKENDCVDIDECEELTHSCHPTAKCVNTQGHFECKCETGATEVIYNTLKSKNNDIKKCKLSCIFENKEIQDRGVVSPRNQPCVQCSCSNGVVTCREPPCDCSNWHKNGNRDLCCPQCDPKESCQHQELKHVTFRSGEQWIYQCQTCECLYGEFDCFSMECPPLNCENPLPFKPGDCCRRCPGDLCGIESSAATISKPCFYEKHSFNIDRSLQLPYKDCSSCTCKVPYCAQLQLVSNSTCFVHR
ncbi:unnamed protein product [Diamesa hyperborea]